MRVAEIKGQLRAYYENLKESYDEEEVRKARRELEIEDGNKD